MTVIRCADCPRKFDVDPAANRPYPDQCDECAEKREETAPDTYGDQIRASREGGSFFFPPTPEDPRPESQPLASRLPVFLIIHQSCGY
jgi:hypothetical protein